MTRIISLANPRRLFTAFIDFRFNGRKTLAMAIAVAIANSCVGLPATAFCFSGATETESYAKQDDEGKQSEATALQIAYPIDVAADSQGNIYVADRQLPGIWKITDGKPEIFFQAEKKFRTPLNAIRCLAVGNDDKLYAGCSTSTEVYRFDDGEPIALTGGQVSVPMNMIVDGDSVFVCDLKMRFLDQIPSGGGELKELAMIQACKAVAVSDEHLIVLTGLEDAIVQLSKDGKQRETLLGNRPFNFPADMLRLADGSLIVSDSYEKCLWKVVDGKSEKWVTDERFSNPTGICLSGEDIILADSRANAIFQIKPDKTVEVIFNGDPIE